MHKTKNDLPEPTREKVVELLNARLADATDLMVQAKQAHWNVKGPQFFQLHELFDKVHGSVEEFVDLVAERCIQLGGVAEGTIRLAAKRSSLAEYPLNLVEGRAHVEALSSALAAFGKLARKAIDQTAELGDQATSDIFTEIVRENDKLLWFVEAHVQA